MTYDSTKQNSQIFRNKIAYLSFCLSILVIMIHTVNLNVYGIESGTLFYIEKAINSIADYAVPTFFMLSGYQFYRGLNNTTIKRKLKSRITTLVIPFLFWGGTEYLFFAALKSIPIIGAQMNTSGNPFAIRILADIILFGESHLWFLRNLILYHISAYLFCRIIKNRHLFPVIIAIFVLVPIFIPIFDAPKGIIKNIPYYLFGAGLSCHYAKWFESNISKIWAVIAGLLAIVFALYLVCSNSSLIAVLIRLFGSLLVWIAASLLPINKRANGFMTQSFFIYVAHIMILECVEKLILIMFKNTLAGAWIDFFLAPVITLIILFLLYLLLHRYEKLWSFLTGSRN